MANRQLIEYVKEQLSHRMDINNLRSLLLQQGWLAEDIEEAIAEAYAELQARTHKHHHINFLGVAIAGIIVAILVVALLLVIFKETEPEPITPVIETPVNTTPQEPWEFCAAEPLDEDKDACYLALNREQLDFDCDSLTIEDERASCNRGKEQAILEAYYA